MGRPVLRAMLCDMLGIDYPILSAGMGPSLVGENTGTPVYILINKLPKTGTVSM
jgi:nitronate monooxygenase